MTDQLDLLGGMGGAARDGEVRWAEAEGGGRLGWAPASLSPDAAKAAKASVVLLVSGDADAAAKAFGGAELDVRVLSAVDHADAARHRAALAADLHAGRIAVVVADELAAAAFVVAGALVEAGSSAAAAIAACGGVAEVGEAHAARLIDAEPETAAPKALTLERPASEASTAEETAPLGAAVDEPEVDEPEVDEPEVDEPEVDEPDAARPESATLELEVVEVRAPAPAEPKPPAAASETAPETKPGSESSAPSEADDGDLTFEDRELELTDAAVFDEAPFETTGDGTAAEEPAKAAPAPMDVHASSSGLGPWRSRLVGAVLGGAIGDAMGHPTEFISSFESLRARFGPDGVQGYELWREEGGARFAPYTDDTQMAECVLRALLAGRAGEWGLERTMRDLAQRFVKWSKEPQGGHRAPGNACLAGCRSLERGVHWSEAGGEKAGGCGSVMRAYPFGLIFADDLQRAERWAVAHSKLTHRDPIALAASAAMAVGVARALRGERPTLVLSEMIGAACRYSPRTAEMMARALDEAQRGVEPEVTLTRLEGWAAHEAIAAAVYLFARHPDDARAAILEGANTPGDSDSLATLVGALCGARLGVEGLPADWSRDVERADALTSLALSVDA